MAYNYKGSENVQVRNTSDINTSYLKRIKEIWIACLGLFCASMGGGLILAWWNFKFHPSNSQLWMVPSGLILLVTPLLIWFSVLLDSCNSGESDDHHLESLSSFYQTVKLPHDYPQDLERSF